MAKKSKLLEQIGKQMKDIQIEIEDMDIEVLKELTIAMKDVTDFRADISYQPLENIIMITFVCLLANCNEWTEIHEFATIKHKWFARFLDLKYGIPSLSTIRRTMSVVDPKELETVCVEMIIKKIDKLQNLLRIEESKEKDIISYDGKVCCGSKRDDTKDGKIKPVNAMTAFNVTKDISLATCFIEDKTNEIPTGPELIKLLDLTNTISTFDALNTQEKTIKAIADKHGDYVAALKGNQHNFYDEVVEYFKDKELYKKAYDDCHYEESEGSHNQIEKRTYILTEDIGWLNTKKWEKIKTIGMCKKECIKKDKREIEVRYYISSLSIKDIKDFARAVRGEWGIENNLHWYLDVTFKEDANTTMNKNAQANLNILRKLALNILKLVKPFYNKSLKLIRFRLGQNFEQEIANVLKYLNTNELEKITSQS